MADSNQTVCPTRSVDGHAIDADGDALFLDFDGTLVHFADRPDEVVVPDTLKDTLVRLSERFGGALALVSGRGIASLDSLLANVTLPAAGVHGLELRRTGEIVVNLAELDRLAPARDFLESQPRAPGIRIEDKGGAIVLHYRGNLELADEAMRLARSAAATDEGLVAVAGHAIAEVRPSAITKAGAIEAFLEEPPFRGRRPIFAGDDHTDEDGIAAAQRLGGLGIRVGVGESVAKARLAGVDEVRAWLSSLA